MTEPEGPEASAAQTPEELRAFIGQRVRVLRDRRQEGVGELLEVRPGTFQVWNPATEQTEDVEVEDHTLHWTDDQDGDVVAARRYSNVWHLVAAPAE